VASIACFFVAKKYTSSAVFGKAYLALALGLLMFVFGEISFLYDYNWNYSSTTRI